MKPLSSDTNQLLARARGASVLPPERRAQIKAQLMTRIAAGSALATATTVTASSKAAWLFGPVAKGFALLTAISSVGTGAFFALHANDSASRSAIAARATSSASSVAFARTASTASTAAPSVSTVTPAASAEVEGEGKSVPASPSALTSAMTPEPGSAASHAAVAAAKPGRPSKKTSAATPAEASSRAAAASVTADTLAEETRLLREADQALRGGNTSRALGLLDEHAKRFPHGVLAGERNAERMIARCKLGQVDGTSLEAYLVGHPNSAFGARIRDACAAH